MISNTEVLTLHGNKWKGTVNLYKFRVVILCELTYIAQLQEMQREITVSSELG